MLAVIIFVFTRKLFIRLVWLSLVINRPTLNNNNDIVVILLLIGPKLLPMPPLLHKALVFLMVIQVGLSLAYPLIKD